MIVNGQNQSIFLETNKQGQKTAHAECQLTNDKGTWYVKIPGSVTVNRSLQNMTIGCTKEAEEKGAAVFKSSTKAMAFGNVIFGGPLGVGVDMATAAAYDYPSLIFIELGQLNGNGLRLAANEPSTISSSSETSAIK